MNYIFRKAEGDDLHLVFLPVGNCIDGEYKGILRQKILITD